MVKVAKSTRTDNRVSALGYGMFVASNIPEILYLRSASCYVQFQTNGAKIVHDSSLVFNKNAIIYQWIAFGGDAIYQTDTYQYQARYNASYYQYVEAGWTPEITLPNGKVIESEYVEEHTITGNASGTLNFTNGQTWASCVGQDSNLSISGDYVKCRVTTSSTIPSALPSYADVYIAFNGAKVKTTDALIAGAVYQSVQS